MLCVLLSCPGYLQWAGWSGELFVNSECDVKAEAVPALGQPSPQLWPTALMCQSSEAPPRLMPPQSPPLVGVLCHLVTLLSPRLLLASPAVLLTVRLSWSSCGALTRQSQLLEPSLKSRLPGHYADSCLSPAAASLSQLSSVDCLFHFSFLWRKGFKAPPWVEIHQGLFFFVFLLPSSPKQALLVAAWQPELLPAWALWQMNKFCLRYNIFWCWLTWAEKMDASPCKLCYQGEQCWMNFVTWFRTRPW